MAVGESRKNDLDLRLPERRRRDEIGVLTEELRRMRDQRHQGKIDLIGQQQIIEIVVDPREQ